MQACFITAIKLVGLVITKGVGGICAHAAQEELCGDALLSWVCQSSIIIKLVLIIINNNNNKIDFFFDF